MHDIEPHFHWRHKYIANEDERSPFYGQQYDEFTFSNTIYNYYIHPQWDNFGSATLYLKILFVEYHENYAIIELIGEWNDCLSNDIMFLKRDVIDHLKEHGITKFILLCENVLNFHGSDDCYYEEWYEDIRDDDAWICFANTLDHVEEEMRGTGIHHYVNLGEQFNYLAWRSQQPKIVFKAFELLINGENFKELGNNDRLIS